MSLSTANTVISRCICIICLIAITIAVGAIPTVAIAKTAGAVSGLQQAVATQACQGELSTSEAAITCVSDDISQTSTMPCPMMGSPCVNMTAGVSHCAPLALIGVSGLQAVVPMVATAGYIRTEYQATGLPAEPLFQPPIL